MDSIFMRIIIFVMAITTSGQVLSATGKVVSEVTRTLTDHQNFGLCMAVINPGPETILPSCGPGWVTFSCSGDFNSKSSGNLKFQTAQLAFISSARASVFVDDTKKHNGYCFVQRIDVFR